MVIVQKSRRYALRNSIIDFSLLSRLSIASVTRCLHLERLPFLNCTMGTFQFENLKDDDCFTVVHAVV